jgi:hypothetical protein
MKYWLLRRPPHYSEIHPNSAGVPKEYDKVSMDVRLKGGDIAYLIAAYGELYGWGHVIKRESYHDSELQHKAYKVTVTCAVIRQNLLSADDIKRVPELADLFTNSDLNLLELTATQANVFNRLLRSQGVMAPADVENIEPEVKPVPNYDFPRLPLLPEERVWLEAVYDRLKAGRKVETDEMLVELWGKIPEDFEYKAIDRRLMNFGVELTLLGILHIDPSTEFASETDQVIRFIKELIKKEPGIQEVTAEQVSEGLTLPEERVAIVLGLVKDLGRFWNGASGYGGRSGYSSITIKEEHVKREYLSYKGIEHLLQKFYKDREPEQQQTKISTTNELAETSGEVKSTQLPAIDIFISHSSQDGKIAQALIELLVVALNIPAERIRCTSVKGHQLGPGASVEETLRGEINDSKAFIGLITPASLQSTYVLFELGARWGIQRHLVPALALGVDANALKDPLKNRNTVRCDVPEQVSDLIDNIASVLNLTPGRKSSYQRYVDALVRRSKVKRKRTAPQNKTTAEGISTLQPPQERPELSPEEREILIAAAERGDILLSSSDEGRWITAGTRTFPENLDPVAETAYIEALESLCGRGLVKYDEGDLYRLTSLGFKIAKGIKQDDTGG